MKEPKEKIAEAIIRARADLEQVLSDLEKMPSVDLSSVHFVVHALNNFLTVTWGTVELLLHSLEEYPDPQVHVYLKNLKHANELMTHTVRQLNKRGAAEERQLYFEKVETAPGLDKLLEYYQTKAHHKQIRIIMEPVTDIPAVWTDRIAAGAVIDNILSNAVKYSLPGKNIHIRIERRQSAVVFTVCDGGPGLSQEEQRQLFKRGVRLSPRPTGGEPSAGYGLAVAKELAEQLGGAIWCESEPGKGSCFSFRVPIYQEQIHGPVVSD